MERNPFINTQIEVISVRKLYETKRKKDQNENAEYSIKQYVDKKNSTSIYREPGLEENLFRLSINAMKVFNFIILHLGRNKEKINLNFKRLQSVIEFKSQRSYHRYINELRDANLIRKVQGSRNMYWINPHFIFNGARINYLIKKYGKDVIIVKGGVTS